MRNLREIASSQIVRDTQPNALVLILGPSL
jgi:hypothetical protein